MTGARPAPADAAFCAGAGVFFTLGLLVALASTVRADQTVVSSERAADLAAIARSTARDGSMRVEGLALDGDAGVVGLDLVRFDVATRDARFVTDGVDGPRRLHPDLPTYLRGVVRGRPGSIAVLSVHHSGEIRGIVADGEGTWVLGATPATRKTLRARRVRRSATSEGGAIECRTLENPEQMPAEGVFEDSAAPRGFPLAMTARIALELDYAYYAKFGYDAEAAIVYALDLMAFTSTLTAVELGMDIMVPFLHLWTRPDSYTGASQARLHEFGRRWQTAGTEFCGGVDCTTVARTTALLLSGVQNLGGIAYLPGICGWYRPTGAVRSYAFASSMDGNFDLDDPRVVRDIVYVTHELGHNFGSHHTHCYGPPVDRCHGVEPGCYAGVESLPEGCPGSGQGCATLMSYCELSEMTLTYGAGHPHGIDPDRVPSRMRARLTQAYLETPDCLRPMPVLTVTTSGNGGRVTSVPAGIDCGSECSAHFDENSVVRLVADPGAFAEFLGWSGDPDCADGSVLLSSAKDCVATFRGTCGPSDADCDDDNPCTQDFCVDSDHCGHASGPREATNCFAAGTAKVHLRYGERPGSRWRLDWNWRRGEAFDRADLGSPESDTSYALCVYDTSTSGTRVANFFSVSPSGTNWEDDGTDGWSYTNGSGGVSGITRLDLGSGAARRSRIRLQGAGPALDLRPPFSASQYFDQHTSVEVQLVSSDGPCWTSRFDLAGTARNSRDGFKARGR